MEKAVLYKESFKIGELERSARPKFINSHKQKIYQASVVPAQDDPRVVVVSKWKEINYPNTPPSFPTELTMFQDSFSYPPSPQGELHWHVNFADANLFGYYGGSLFAQDEIQVTEHPILASVRDVMAARGINNSNASPLTRRGGRSTPVLIQGAHRRAQVNLGRSAGAPAGLYGRAFAQASWDAVSSALTILNPPTETNFIAMEAPKGGHGVYTRSQIDDAFNTAFSAFSAAKFETSSKDPNLRTVIHTGNWGTGAFGGNRILMAFVQILAAKTAQIHQLVYHSFDGFGTDAYNEALQLISQMEDKKIMDILHALEGMNFKWGQSDGN